MLKTHSERLNVLKKLVVQLRVEALIGIIFLQNSLQKENGIIVA